MFSILESWSRFGHILSEVRRHSLVVGSKPLVFFKIKDPTKPDSISSRMTIHVRISPILILTTDSSKPRLPLKSTRKSIFVRAKKGHWRHTPLSPLRPIFYLHIYEIPDFISVHKFCCRKAIFLEFITCITCPNSHDMR